MSSMSSSSSESFGTTGVGWTGVGRVGERGATKASSSSEESSSAEVSKAEGRMEEVRRVDLEGEGTGEERKEERTAVPEDRATGGVLDGEMGYAFFPSEDFVGVGRVAFFAFCCSSCRRTSASPSVLEADDSYPAFVVISSAARFLDANDGGVPSPPTDTIFPCATSDGPASTPSIDALAVASRVIGSLDVTEVPDTFLGRPVHTGTCRSSVPILLRLEGGSEASTAARPPERVVMGRTDCDDEARTAGGWTGLPAGFEALAATRAGFRFLWA